MKRKKQKPAYPKTSQTLEQRHHEKLHRLAHHILIKTIEPANLQLEDVIDVLAIVAKGIVLSNTKDDDPEDRSGMIDWIQDHFLMQMDAIHPLTGIPQAWIVQPQGLITEPVGIVWPGPHGDEESCSGAKVLLGPELDLFREGLANNPGSMQVTHGVEGLAVINPTWDGEATVTCTNPQCGEVHDAHLNTAEILFQDAVERRQLVTQPN